MTESAIPPHLRVPRTVPPKRNPPVGRSSFASFSHMLGENVKTLSIAYIGLQSQTASWDELAETMKSAPLQLDGNDGPDHRDRARYVDEAGFRTVMIAAYWLDAAQFRSWMSSAGMDWVDPIVPADGHGRFLELLWPGVDRVETIVSSSEGREGFGAIAESISAPIAEHGYWGSMRDRLPVAQVSTIEAGLAGPARHDSPRLSVVRLDANACIIRSGQDYSDTTGDERDYYLNEVEPTLRRGMDYLRDEGLPIGCYINRYVHVLDEDYAETERSYSVSWWTDMASLEDWAALHPTHVAIFGGFMQHMSRFDQDAQLRLYHEVMVPDAEQQEFWYLDCHPGTGLLRAGVATTT